MPEYPKIDIIYETNHLLVVKKPTNIPVCGDETKDIDLLTILRAYIKDKYHKPGNVYLGLVHRLDRPVSGIMVFAKTSKCASRLSKQINDGNFQKEYYAVIEGTPKTKDIFEDYLIKDEKQNISKVTTKEKGKYSKLEYDLVKTVNNYSLVKIKLYTGRSHQIRVQFSSRGYPLLGDMKYGTGKIKCNIALFAYRLSFLDPITKEKLEFKLDLPDTYPFDIFK